MVSKMRREGGVCALLLIGALVALIDCGRTGKEPKPGAVGQAAPVQTVAVPPPPGQPQLAPGGAGPIERHLFPPDFLMVHQLAIGIRNEQREAIIAAVQEAQSKVLRLQWEMGAATAQIERELEGPRVDEAKAVGISQRITTVEGEIKRTHLAMLIRIKNLLNEDQQRRLNELRQASAAPRR